MSEWGYVLLGCTIIGLAVGDAVATLFFGVGAFIEYLRYNGELK